MLLKLMEGLANESDTTRGTGNGARSSSGEREGIRGLIAGGAFLCSVPPSGNGPMTKRFIKEVRRGIATQAASAFKKLPWSMVVGLLQRGSARCPRFTPPRQLMISAYFHVGWWVHVASWVTVSQMLDWWQY